MKKYHILLGLLLSFKSFAQNDSKTAFQKSRYELAVSYYKKADFRKALDLFSIASKLKPENELGKESTKQVDALKTILRNDVLSRVVGKWKLTGDKPTWAQTTITSQNDIEEIIEINQDKILFFETDKKTLIKKMVKSEDLKYYNKDVTDGVFSDIILSDGTIWSCLLDEEANVLHVINIAKQTEKGIENITSNNEEAYFVRIK